MERKFCPSRTGAGAIFNIGKGRPSSCKVFTKMPRSSSVLISRDDVGLDDLTPDKVYFEKLEMRQAA